MAKATERRLDRALAISEAERSRLLALALSRQEADLGTLLATSPAPAPPPDPALGVPEPPAVDWDAAAVDFEADPNLVSEWDADDDAAFGSVRH